MAESVPAMMASSHLQQSSHYMYSGSFSERSCQSHSSSTAVEAAKCIAVRLLPSELRIANCVALRLIRFNVHWEAVTCSSSVSVERS
eukprot:3333052-Amphidinium_carterae.1